MEIGELEGEKVFLKYGKYGRCISCGGTVAQVRGCFLPTHPRLLVLQKTCGMERIYDSSVMDLPGRAGLVLINETARRWMCFEWRKLYHIIGDHFVLSERDERFLCLGRCAQIQPARGGGVTSWLVSSSPMACTSFLAIRAYAKHVLFFQDVCSFAEKPRALASIISPGARRTNHPAPILILLSLLPPSVAANHNFVALLPTLRPPARLQLPQQYRKTKSNPEPEEISVEEAVQLILEKRAKDSPATARVRAKKAGGSGKGATAAAAAAAGGAGKKRKGRAAGSGGGGGKRVASSGPKRPLSGFFRFCKDSREMHTAAAAATAGGPAATSLSSETLSARWKALPEDERQGFNAAASAALDLWKADNLKAENGGNGRVSSGGSSKSGGSVSRIPPPKNAYILFSSERRPGLKEEVGGGLNAVEMTKKLAKEWRELEGSSVREEYARRAAVLKEAWVKEKEKATAALRGAPVWVGGGVGGGLKKKAAAAAETVTTAAG